MYKNTSMKTHLYIIAFLLCILSAQAQKPLLQWTFDEVSSDSILGNTIITEGVSGKALIFDGYNTEITHKTHNQKQYP